MAKRNQQDNDVNLAQLSGVSQNASSSPSASKVTKAKKAKAPKPPISSYRKVVTTFLLVLLAALLFFLIWGGLTVWEMVKEPSNQVIDFPLYNFTRTPEDKQDKVEYYVVGLFGEDQNSSAMEMVSVLAVDKVVGSINILQIPQNTYVGDDKKWSASRVADIWANPTELYWCETERKAVALEDVDAKANTHNGCGGLVVKKSGSSSGDLCQLINIQYGLPVDGYILFPQKALVKLVNQLGGIDVDLEQEMTVTGEDNKVVYPKGEQTLDGDAALSYALRKGDGIKGDCERLVRIRKVFLALFDRFEAQGVELMKSNSLGPVMNGDTPLRLYLDGKTLLDAEKHYLSVREVLMEKIMEFKSIPAENIRAFVLPGTSKKVDKTTYFSPNKGQLLELLNSNFRPHLDPITLENLSALPDIASGKGADLYEQVFSDFAVVQEYSPVADTTASTSKTTK